MLRKIFMLLVATAFVAGISSLSYAMSCGDMDSGHSQHQQVAQAQSGHSHESVSVSEAASEKAVNVGNKICPISGEKIDEKTKATYEYNGKVYNFCCSNCIDEFKKDPEKYIKKIEEELQSEAKGQSEHKEHDMEMMQESGMSHEDMQGGHHH